MPSSTVTVRAGVIERELEFWVNPCVCDPLPCISSQGTLLGVVLCGEGLGQALAHSLYSMNVKTHISYFATGTEFCVCQALGQTWGGTDYWEVFAGLWGTEKHSPQQLRYPCEGQHSLPAIVVRRNYPVDPIQAGCLEEGCYLLLICCGWSPLSSLQETFFRHFH